MDGGTEMKKVLINVTERQHKALKQDAETIGIPMAEYIRRVFDAYLEDKLTHESQEAENRKSAEPVSETAAEPAAANSPQ
jgi:hypothetical protein